MDVKKYVKERDEMIQHYTSEIEGLELELSQSLEIIKMQKAEIERLKGEKNDWKQRYDSESTRYSDICNASSECAKKKNERIAALQKKVDELKEERENMQAEIFGLEKEKRQLGQKVDELKSNKIIKCYGDIRGCEMGKKASKDTAEEIWTVSHMMIKEGVIEQYFDVFTQWIKERFMAEVE